MGRYIIGRSIVMVPVVWLVLTFVFLMVHLLPGDPAQLMLAGQGALSASAVEQLRRSMGLNQPLYVQYGQFAWKFLHGDLGQSAQYRQPVLRIVLSQFPSTIQLALAGMGIAILLGLVFGMVAALSRNSWFDVVSMTFALTGVSMPIFWLGLLLIFLFSFQLHWLPSTGIGGWQRLVMPAVTIGIASAGIVARLVRSSLLEVLRQPHVATARAKGLAEAAVVGRHVLRNALIPVVTLVGLQFGAMLSGAVITETVFGRPGIGRLAVDAITWKDFPLVQGTVLFTSIIYLCINLAVDVAYASIDPRISYQ